MTTQTEALKLALEALKEIHVGNMTPMAEINWNKAVTAIKEALAQPEQEPVAWMNEEMDCIFFDAERPEPFDFDFWKPLYTTPPQRKPLTVEALLSAAQSCLSPQQYDHFEALLENDPDAHNRLARAIENERYK